MTKNVLPLQQCIRNRWERVFQEAHWRCCQNQLARALRQWQSASVEIGQFIVKTPGTCGGRARLAGKRIPVSSVYRWFLSGFEPEDILEKYEGATLAEIYAAITYAL